MPASRLTHQFAAGGTTWFPSDSSVSEFSVAFEDDEETGYLYAYDCSGAEPVVVDAVQIYDVGAAGIHGVPHTAEIAWSEDGQKAELFLNRQLEAVVDFAAKTSSSKLGHPPPSAGWARGTLPPS